MTWREAIEKLQALGSIRYVAQKVVDDAEKAREDRAFRPGIH